MTSANSVFTRRAFLSASSLIAALTWAAPAWARRAPQLVDAFDSFLADWKSLHASHLSPDSEHEEGYLHRLAARLSTLALDDIPAMQQVVFESEALTTGPVWYEGALSVVALRLEPGALLRPHNHPGYAVVTLGLKGSAQYHHYELQGPAPAFEDHETSFEVRRTRTGVLLPGARTHLSRRRDNIHAFQAGAEGVVMLDFAVQRNESDFGMLEIQAAEANDGPPTHSARWRNKEY